MPWSHIIHMLFETTSWVIYQRSLVRNGNQNTIQNKKSFHFNYKNQSSEYRTLLNSQVCFQFTLKRTNIQETNQTRTGYGQSNLGEHLKNQFVPNFTYSLPLKSTFGAPLGPEKGTQGTLYLKKMKILNKTMEMLFHKCFKHRQTAHANMKTKISL